MTTHPVHYPVLVVLALLIAGIAAGRATDALSYVSMPCLKWILHPLTLCITTISLAITSIILKRRERMATVMLLAAVFVLGVFLIKVNDITRGKESQGIVIPVPLAYIMNEERGRLASIYSNEGLTGDAYAVVTAMTLGERQYISRNLREAYNISGATHIFALSGLHLSIIFFIFGAILPRRHHPKTCGIVMLTALWAYVMLVGARASVVRAATMLSFYTLLPMLGRHTSSSNSVLAACFLLLVICPSWLFDIGFQMSFAAVCSISVFYKPLYRLINFTSSHKLHIHIPPKEKPQTCIKDRLKHFSFNAFLTITKWGWGLFVLSIVTQIAVAPFIAYYFGRFSPYFLLTNYIVSPCAFLIIALSFAVLFLGTVSTFIPIVSPVLSICATLLHYTATFQNSAIELIAGFPAV